MKRQLKRFMAFGLDLWLWVNRAYLIGRQGAAVGEQITMTAVVTAMRKAGCAHIWVCTSMPSLFAHHPHVDRVIDLTRLHPLVRRMLLVALESRTRRHAPFVFEHPRFPGYIDYCRETGERKSLVELNAMGLTIPHDLAGVLPVVAVTDEEQRVAMARDDWPRAPFALLHSVGKMTWTANKAWEPGRFQQVVDATPEIAWVQVGMSDDQLLTGVHDLRGRTTLRELAVLVKQARMVLCLESVYTHLAAAENTPSVTLYMFNHPSISQYPKNLAVHVQDQIPCAPCWQIGPCPVPGRPCSAQLGAERVVQAVRMIWAVNPD